MSKSHLQTAWHDPGYSRSVISGLLDARRAICQSKALLRSYQCEALSRSCRPVSCLFRATTSMLSLGPGPTGFTTIRRQRDRQRKWWYGFDIQIKLLYRTITTSYKNSQMNRYVSWKPYIAVSWSISNTSMGQPFFGQRRSAFMLFCFSCPHTFSSLKWWRSPLPLHFPESCQLQLIVPCSSNLVIFATSTVTGHEINCTCWGKSHGLYHNLPARWSSYFTLLWYCLQRHRNEVLSFVFGLLSKTIWIVFTLV